MCTYINTEYWPEYSFKTTVQVLEENKKNDKLLKMIITS